MLFEGRVVVVTGGAGGIGRATVESFAHEGAHVVIADLDDGGAQKVADTLVKSNAPKSLAIKCDVSNEASVTQTVDAALSNFGRLDAVVNNAGLMVFKPIEELTSDDWIKVLHVVSSRR